MKLDFGLLGSSLCTLVAYPSEVVLNLACGGKQFETITSFNKGDHLKN